MRRLTIGLLVIALLGLLCSYLPVFAESNHIPHENPATAARDLPDAVSLLLFYGNVFDLTAVSQYRDAQNMLNELEYANIPDEIRYIIDRCNSLAGQLVTALNNLELLLDETAALLSRYQISDASQKLDVAEEIIISVQLLLGDVEAATNTLGAKLNVFTASARESVLEAYASLEESLRRLGQLIDELNRLRQSLNERYHIQAQVELIPTELSLNISSSSAFVGDSITIWGRLTTAFGALDDREITLLLGVEQLTVTTDSDGSYITSSALPYKYVPSVDLIATYLPAGDDFYTYSSCESLPVVINTNFFSTKLEVSAPETANPGLPVTVGGRISSSGDPADRIIKLLLDDVQLAEEIVRGDFNFQVTIPPQVSSGKHSLILFVVSQERYSDVSEEVVIDIFRFPLQADIHVPNLIIIPKLIHIRGEVCQDLCPVQGAKVSLAFRDSSCTVITSADGSFTADIEAPLNLFGIGPWQLGIIIEPSESWYASFSIKKQIFTLNSVNISLMFILFLSLGLFVYRRVRTRSSSPQREIIVPGARVLKTPVVTPPLSPDNMLTGIRGVVLSAYLSGLEVVGMATGISIAPHITLREFLTIARPRLSGAVESFAELTRMAESALYSARDPDPYSAFKAEQLAAAIKEELRQ